MSHWVEFRQSAVTFIRMHTHTRNTQTEQTFGEREREIMPFRWSVRSVENYSEISCATHIIGMDREYPTFTVKDSSGYVIEEVEFHPMGDGQLSPLPDTDNEHEVGLYLSRIDAWIEHNVTQMIVWATMAVGLNHISNKNIDEWMRRIEILNDAGYGGVTFHDLQFDRDALKFKSQVERVITREDLERRIGLSTNANTQNKSEFNKSINEWKKEKVNA